LQLSSNLFSISSFLWPIREFWMISVVSGMIYRPSLC
jgi:hypothetical protein